MLGKILVPFAQCIEQLGESFVRREVVCWIVCGENGFHVELVQNRASGKAVLQNRVGLLPGSGRTGHIQQFGDAEVALKFKMVRADCAKYAARSATTQ